MSYDREQVWKRRFIGNPKVAFDDCGAEIHRDAPENSLYSWEVDHIFPEKILKLLKVPERLRDHKLNLRPLHHSNNEAKGMLYPEYVANNVGEGYKRGRRIRTLYRLKLYALYASYIRSAKLELRIKKILGVKLSANEQLLIDFFQQKIL